MDTTVEKISDHKITTDTGSEILNYTAKEFELKSDGLPKRFSEGGIKTKLFKASESLIYNHSN